MEIFIWLLFCEAKRLMQLNVNFPVNVVYFAKQMKDILSTITTVTI